MGTAHPTTQHEEFRGIYLLCWDTGWIEPAYQNTSFQQELNKTGEKLARHCLANLTLPGAQISFLLGFDDPNSFAWAFRSWTGQTSEKVWAEIRH